MEARGGEKRSGGGAAESSRGWQTGRPAEPDGGVAMPPRNRWEAEQTSEKREEHAGPMIERVRKPPHAKVPFGTQIQIVHLSDVDTTARTVDGTDVLCLRTF
jgi:hypothetical protein